MTTTAVSVCNLALGRIGATAIVTLADATAEGVQCNLHYEPTRDALLRSHPWRFASLWVELVRDAAANSGTSTGTGNTTLKLYDTGKAWGVNGYANYYLWITGGTGANQIRKIASNTATVLTVSVAFTTTPDDTSTYEIWQNYPPYPWDNQFDLPSDILRLNRTYPSGVAYELNNGLLKTAEDEMAINYVKQVTDPDDFDALFVDALVLSLASKLVMPLLRDKVWQRELDAEALEVVRRARLVNLAEGKPAHVSQTWNEARYGPDS